MTMGHVKDKNIVLSGKLLVLFADVGLLFFCLFTTNVNSLQSASCSEMSYGCLHLNAFRTQRAARKVTVSPTITINDHVRRGLILLQVSFKSK